jgi:hypothetical protein
VADDRFQLIDSVCPYDEDEEEEDFLRDPDDEDDDEDEDYEEDEEGTWYVGPAVR